MPRFRAASSGSVVALHGAKGRFHPHVAVLIANPGVGGDAIADERHRGNSQNTEADDHGNHDQNDFEGIAALWSCSRGS